MKKNEYQVIGVMSGTSLDGIDLVFAKFRFDRKWSFKIVFSETIEYEKQWHNILQGLTSCAIEELYEIDEDYTSYLSKNIRGFIEKYNIENIDAVCSHGHTALHQPENNLTYQIGNKASLAKKVNETVVCDFRVQDVELGGQGAPLVPIGDKLLFSEYDFCLNLGGFANISTDINEKRVAYDVCPVNIVLNHYTKKLGFDYDDGGKIASKGNINEKLLKALNELPFYNESHPKSLGLEWVNENIFPLIDPFKLEVPDILKTFVEHISTQLALEINKKTKASVLISGGGVYNKYLMKCLENKANNSIVIPLKYNIEFKEALIFGFLGVLKLRNEINCLKSVTGASQDHSSGKIYSP